jgi:glutathione synthase/RimK-type ligase-like ATP-grasp enzyme/gamma-glutamyl:cysteine ligase YbdK (ATP-grasp superfamily)
MRREDVLIVVSDLSDLPADAGQIVTADDYLAGEGKAARRKLTVVNLCRSWRYLSKGYYVSLLADARGQHVLPTIATIEGMSSPHSLFRALQEADVDTVDVSEMSGRRRTLPAVIAPSDEAGGGRRRKEVVPLVRQTVRGKILYRPARDADIAEVLVFLGQCRDKRFHRLAAAIFRAWPSPILRVRFLREDEAWKVIQVTPLMFHRLSAEDQHELTAALKERPLLGPAASKPRQDKHAALSVLWDENDRHKPSTSETMDRLERVAARRGIHVRRIGTNEISKLGDYDALFIRTLTGLDQPAFRFAQRAEALGMPVIDDTRSIICCTNKVYLHELLTREGVPTPSTMVATRQSRFEEIEQELGLPFIVKLPDGSFSAAVHKVQSEEDYDKRAGEMLKLSPLIVAQAYTPTGFDWRVTTLDGKPLFVCKYHMAPGHWQIREATRRGVSYGKVEAVPRDLAPREVLRVALRAARLIGDGLYGVDLKETADGPMVIEVNDNPNIDIGYDDAADGDVIYEEVLSFLMRRVEQSVKPKAQRAPASARRQRDPALAALRKPIGRRVHAGPERAYQAYEVCGIELEYPVVDRDLNVRSLVEPAFAMLAGRPRSDVDLGVIGFSNEIYDHVFEIKTTVPLRSLVESEEALVEGVQRFSLLLADRFDARLLPTGMHPWLDPAQARMWSRSNSRIYQTYSRLFNVKTHGWANVQACHVNLPMGRDHEAVAMMCSAALLVPYLPALAASTPMYDGELQPAVDNRLAFILEHQARVPESTGRMVPEYIESLDDYRKKVLRPMYRALDRLQDARVLRSEFFNARGAVLKFSRSSMEVRALDTQECVKMDLAIAAFVRAALKALSERLLTGKLELPEHDLLVADFHAAVWEGTKAKVHAPHLCVRHERDEAGRLDIRHALAELFALAERKIRPDEGPYLELVAGIIENGNLSERMAAVLRPHLDDEQAFTDTARRLYIELAQCLLENEPWPGRVFDR